jgi:hypothetical protein
MKLRNFLIPVSIAVQSLSIQAQEAAPDNWFNLDFEQDKVRGVSTEKAYKELLKGKKSTSIIVSIIDSGVDEEHEDLKEVMWVNKDEIAGNGIDDDKNGYIDDIHGWNFIGGKDGKNINQDQLEVTRLYVYLKDKKRNKKEEAQFKTIKEEIDKKIGQAQQSVKYFETIISSLDIIDEVMGEQPLTMNNLRAVKVADDDKKNKNSNSYLQKYVVPTL